jgi:hypothetical protein
VANYHSPFSGESTNHLDLQVLLRAADVSLEECVRECLCCGGTRTTKSTRSLERAMGIEPTSEIWDTRTPNGKIWEQLGNKTIYKPLCGLGPPQRHRIIGQLTKADANSKPLFRPVAQVAHLRGDSKDVSGCSTSPYEFSRLVRNEEAEFRRTINCSDSN